VEISAPCRGTKKEEEKPDERTEAQKKADDFKAKANELYKKRSFQEALGQYDEAIKVEPNDAVYYCNKAAVYMEMGEFDQCMATCQAVLDKRYEMNGELAGGASFEKIAKVYNRMAACLQRQKKFDEAIDFYNKALTEDNNKQTRNALRECERIKEKHLADAYLDPALAEQHKEKGNELFKAQKYPDAKKEYEEAIRRNPKDAKIYSNLAGCLNKLGAAPDAIRALDKCLELDPTFVRAYARKGQAHSLMKEHHKALKAYEDGLKIDPSNQELLQGKQAVMYQVQQGQGAGADQEQLRHAMADPEIQEILKDPQMNIVLQNMQDNPSRINEYLQDKKIAEGINKLIAAGVLKVGNAPGGM
jgi:stress-induced-phosphoprotein 1